MQSWDDLLQSWIDYMEVETSLDEKSIAAYQRDIIVWAAWAHQNGLHSAQDVTVSDVKEWRDSLSAAQHKPATINRRLTSLNLFLDYLGRAGADNPSRKVPHLHDADNDEDGRALTRNEWNAVRRQAEIAGPLAEALANLFRHAGPRVGELTPLNGQKPVPFLLGDISITPRSGEIRIRHGKGKRSRAVPLVLEARESLKAYLRGARDERVTAWAKRYHWSEEQRWWWAENPKAPVFLGERGPLTTRGVRRIIAQLGEKAGLDFILGPHDLRATMITSLIDPAKYGYVNRQPVPITVVARLAGHSQITTTARYARPSKDDLLRYMLGDGAVGD